MTTIVAALADVMADVREVKKSEYNQGQRFNFRGVDAVMNAVGPAFRKHGVVCVPEVLEHTIAGKTTAKGAPMNFVTVRVRYHLHGPEGDTVSGVVAAESFDSGDKATAKAMSVAYRTFLLQALCLPTDDPDPDHDTYDEQRPQQGGAEQAPQQEGPPWQEHYRNAKAQGRTSFAAFLAWAEKNNGPADMIAAGKQELAAAPAAEGEVIDSGA